MKEDQKSTVAWVNQAFPSDLDFKTESEVRMNRVLEEIFEMACDFGYSLDRVQEIAKIIYYREMGKYPRRVNNKVYAEFGIVVLSENMKACYEESADVLLTLYAFAEHHGYDLHERADKKMALNRSRPMSYYHEKQRIKKESGL